MRKISHFLPLLALFFLVSCTEENHEKEKHKVFYYNETAVITSLDPAASSNFENIWGVNQIFNGLVQMDDNLTVVPAIARKFSISSDGLVYTFNLRNDVYFHDDRSFPNGKGRKVIADDVIYSFYRLYDSKVSSALSLLNVINRDGSIGNKGIVAENDSTVKIFLKEPFGAFLSMLTMKYFSVVPHEAIDFYKQEFRSNPVGTGPFKFKLWEEGSKLILHKNPNYFEKDDQGVRLPYLEAISVSFIKEKQTAFMEFLNGKLDMISGADAFNINEVLNKNGELNEAYTKKFYLQKSQFLKTDYIGILIDPNMEIVKQSPLRLKAIRQAINYGFDRDKMIKFLRNNIGKPAHAGFVPHGLKSFDESKVKGYTYDPDKVIDLLAEAGFPGGKGLPEITLYTTENFKDLVEYIQSQLSENHIKVQISIEKASVLKQSVNNSQFLMFKKSWVGDYADEENFLSMFYSKNFTPGGFNYTHYSNPKFDEAFELSLKEKNDTVRINLYQKMDQMVIDDAPIVPLFYDEVIRVVNKRITGLGNNPMNLLNVKTVKKD
jgi:oligopeptide transport system substrate-binding protein